MPSVALPGGVVLPPAPPPLPSPYLLTPAHLYHTLNQAVGWSPFCLVPRPSSQVRGIHLGPLRLPPSDDYQSSLLLPAVLSYGAAQRLRRCPQARLTALISPKADIALHWSSVWRDANPAQTRGVAPDGHSMLTGHLSTTRSSLDEAGSREAAKAGPQGTADRRWSSADVGSAHCVHV